ncbi:MAG: cyclodeaminase [Gammaproteobacteria bacterium]|nr:cyclodeaminase [Gammaproteobacteria bacterium]
MGDIIILTETELRSQVQLDLAAIGCVEQAFHALATKAVVMPPIMRLDIIEHSGEIDVKTAYVPGLKNLAIKISTGFFNNPKFGLPPSDALMVLFNTRTGIIEALLLENSYLTNVRTAAAGAIAAKYLSRTDSRSVAILGAGSQADLQLEAVTLVRDIESATIWARDSAKARTSAARLSDRLKLPVSVSDSVQTATAEADIIVTTTPAHEPILLAEHIRAGQHITAMGSDAEHKNEIDPLILANKAKYFCDRLAQVQALGELHHAIEQGMISANDSFTEIGQVIAQQAPGRMETDEITLCDLTGTGIQDTAIATLAYRLCQQHQAGTIFNK